MKKIVLMTVTFFGMYVVSAQSEKAGFDFGVRGGVNFSNITTSDDLDAPNSRTSFYAGLVAELPLQERFSLQGEVFYSSQGYERTIPLLGNDKIDFKLKADYIQVPILAKFYVVKGLSIAVGPQFGFKVNEKIDYGTSGNGAVNPVDLNTFDFQGTGGLEYKLDNGLFIQGRYSYGFSDLISNSHHSHHTSVFSAGLGYMF